MAVDIRFLGQSCFELKAGGATVLTDPFLTGNPLAAASADEVEADAILLTHGHGDHLGDTVAMWQKFKPRVIAPVELRGWLERQGVASNGGDNPNKGGTVDVDGVKIPLIGLNDLVETKRTGRLQDAADIEVLEEIKRRVR